MTFQISLHTILKATLALLSLLALAQPALAHRGSINVTSPPPADKDCPSFGVTFDIDGVLHRAGLPLPHAAASLAALRAAAVPHTFLTNGGGATEADKAAALAALLAAPVDPAHYIQSHTPYRDLAPSYADKLVLAVGLHPCAAARILRGYGFRRVLTSAELHAARPGLWPFFPGAGDHVVCPDSDAIVAASPAGITGTTTPPPLPRIHAVLFLNDPAHWQLDLQILTDLLAAQSGVLGTVSPSNNNASLPNRGWCAASAQVPALHFSASDLEFSSAWPVPRFGQGAFVAALRGIWAVKTGSAAVAFPHTLHGKPMASQYAYVERRERELAEEAAGRVGAAERCPPLARNYMIGDNPESDIRGAQEYKSEQGTEWLGVLVKTGVWDGVSELSVQPRHIVDGVKEAVELIGKLEGVDIRVKE